MSKIKFISLCVALGIFFDINMIYSMDPKKLGDTSEYDINDDSLLYGHVEPLPNPWARSTPQKNPLTEPTSAQKETRIALLSKAAKKAPIVVSLKEILIIKSLMDLLNSSSPEQMMTILQTAKCLDKDYNVVPGFFDQFLSKNHKALIVDIILHALVQSLMPTKALQAAKEAGYWNAEQERLIPSGFEGAPTTAEICEMIFTSLLMINKPAKILEAAHDVGFLNQGHWVSDAFSCAAPVVRLNICNTFLFALYRSKKLYNMLFLGQEAGYLKEQRPTIVSDMVTASGMIRLPDEGKVRQAAKDLIIESSMANVKEEVVKQQFYILTVNMLAEMIKDELIRLDGILSHHKRL